MWLFFCTMNEKPLGHKSYGSIPHLSYSRLGPADHTCEPGQERIATKQPRDKNDLIIVQEKLDGSNCSIAKIKGEIIPLGRAGYRAETSPYKLHHLFAEWVFENKKRFEHVLKEGERIVGEWLAQAHGTRYKLPHEPFVVFDIMSKGHERMCYHDFLLRVLPQQFIVPRLIHLGQPISVEKVLKKLEPSGHGAIDPVEGAVWRVERKGKVDFLVKYLRSDKVDGCYLPENNNGKEVWNIDISSEHLQ